jgi:peptidoglycan hydrolase-like protein with peptidoglycan-binding domain
MMNTVITVRTCTLFGFVLLACVLPVSVRAQVRDIAFPVQGTFRFSNDFAEARAGGARAHEGIDIIAPKMTPFVAASDGVITFRASPEPSWGFALTLEDADGYQYKYLHVNNDTPGTDDGRGGEQYAYAPQITIGSRVTKGELLGWVGDSGNAEAVGSHLHFEMYAPGRVLINPYESLLRASGGATTGGLLQSSLVTVPVPQLPTRRQLQEGDTGPDVRVLSERLAKAGYLRPSPSLVFTAEVREAVRAFQIATKITATGIADVRTQEALSSTTSLAPVAASPTASPIAFTKDLEVGDTDAEVRALQVFLNAQGFVVATSGAGSPGNESSYFGARTKAALAAFQKARGITPAAGYFGPKTRVMLRAY